MKIEMENDDELNKKINDLEEKVAALKKSREFKSALQEILYFLTAKKLIKANLEATGYLLPMVTLKYKNIDWMQKVLFEITGWFERAQQPASYLGKIWRRIYGGTIIHFKAYRSIIRLHKLRLSSTFYEEKESLISHYIAILVIATEEFFNRKIWDAKLLFLMYGIPALTLDFFDTEIDKENRDYDKKMILQIYLANAIECIKEKHAQGKEND